MPLSKETKPSIQTLKKNLLFIITKGTVNNNQWK